MDKFPEECLRGIPHEDSFIEGGLPTVNLFRNFERRQREDGYDELSITWRDDDNALNLILSQTKDDGSIQFKYGVAVIKRRDLDNLKNNPQFSGILSYERRKTDGNKYHGNILIVSTASKPKRNMVASALAICALKVILNEKAALSACKGADGNEGA